MKKYAFMLLTFIGVCEMAMAWSVPVGANNWTNDVQANGTAIQNNTREFAHGETWYISPRIMDGNTPRNLDANTIWVMYYQTPQMTTNWYANTNVYFPVYNGTTIDVGRVSAKWDASNDFGARSYTWWIGGTVGAQLTYRLTGSITLKDSPGFNAAAATAPVGSWPYASLATVTNVVSGIMATGTAGRATYADYAGVGTDLVARAAAAVAMTNLQGAIDANYASISNQFLRVYDSGGGAWKFLVPGETQP